MSPLALLEHQINPQADVASKIFELGLRFFAHDVDYVVRYLNFLISRADEGSKWCCGNRFCFLLINGPQMPGHFLRRSLARSRLTKHAQSGNAGCNTKCKRPIW